MLPTPLASAVEILKALGHQARLRIVAVLQDGPLSVCQIGAVLGSVPSTVSGHLLDLRRAGLVAEQRQGKWVYYRLDAERPAMAVVKGVFSALASDPQVSDDRSIAAVLRAQSTARSCEAAAPDASHRPPRPAEAGAGRPAQHRVASPPGGTL